MRMKIKSNFLFFSQFSSYHLPLILYIQVDHEMCKWNSHERYILFVQFSSVQFSSVPGSDPWTTMRGIRGKIKSMIIKNDYCVEIVVSCMIIIIFFCFFILFFRLDDYHFRMKVFFVAISFLIGIILLFCFDKFPMKKNFCVNIKK